MDLMASAKKIVLLITTYKRQEKLIRLVRQMSYYIKTYTGSNQYQIAITDSERGNASPFDSNILYMTNQGTGFDLNLLGALRRFAGESDFIFAMGDDDLLSPYLNPLPLVDQATGAGAGAYVFNHYEYVNTDEGINEKVHVGDPLYDARHMRLYQTDPFAFVTQPLPRYCGIIYESGFIRNCLETLTRFDHTLHLYAVPCLIAACQSRLAYYDTPLTMFDITPKTDGAWEDNIRVRLGLLHFCRALQGVVPPAQHDQLLNGFYRDYFSKPSSLFTEKKDLYLFHTKESFLEYLENMAAPG